MLVRVFAAVIMMMPMRSEVTQIKPTAADPNMRRVHVGGRTVATLRAADIETLGIQIGSAWTDSLRDAAQKAADAIRARKAAMSLLGRRGYSRAEVIDKLVQKGHAEPIARQVADELAADRWIDDRGYARALAQHAGAKGLSNRDMITAKLLARKIDPDLSAEVTAEVIDGVDPLQKAISLARKRLAAMGRLPLETSRRRLGAFLGRRGFDDETVAATFERLNLPGESV